MPAAPHVRGRVAFASALGVPLAACLVQLTLRPLIYSAPFILFFLAVAFVSWLAGGRVGLVAMAASVLLANYFFIAPYGTFALSPTGLLSSGLFMLVASLICLLNARASVLAESLLQSEAQFRGFFDLAGVPMGQADATTGRIVRVNAAFCALTGYSEEELVGRPFSELAHPEDREADQERFQSLLRGEVPLYQSEKRYLCKDGRVRWVLVTANLLRTEDGRAERTAAVIQDVTERKAAEEARRKGEEQLRLVTDALPVLIAYIDRELRYRSANFAYRDWFGLEREDVLGRTMAEVVGEAAFAHVRSHVEEALKGQQVTFEAELPYRHGPRHVRASYIPHRGPSGAVEGFVVLVTDISTEVRQARERADLLREAQSAVRLRDEFLSVASHELRTPVTSLTLQLQLLARALPEDSRERTRLATAERQVERLRSLVESLLDVSRITAGQMELRRTEADLRELAGEALERLNPVFSQAGCSVRFEAPGGPVPGQWDIQRVDQVLVNLLSNAAKYGAGKPVHLRVWQEGERALFSVRDEGIGIAPEVLPRLFGRFERGVSDRNYGGLGLGLYISRQLVEAMGGRIHVQSEHGQGTLFTVELPRAG